jgi:hypothetical protein
MMFDMHANLCVERAKNKRLASKCPKQYSCSKEPYNTVIRLAFRHEAAPKALESAALTFPITFLLKSTLQVDPIKSDLSSWHAT